MLMVKIMSKGRMHEVMRRKRDGHLNQPSEHGGSSYEQSMFIFNRETDRGAIAEGFPAMLLRHTKCSLPAKTTVT